MTEAPESRTEPTAVAAEHRRVQPLPEPNRSNTLVQLAVWVGVIAGVVFVVAVIFFSGFVIGKHSGGEFGGGHGSGRGMYHDSGPSQMGPGGMMGPGQMGPGQMGPSGPMGPGQQSPTTTPAATAFGWITALRAPDIATLAAEQGPLQMSLFDTQDLAEISHLDYPGERLITCRNPALAAERARKRTELLAATDTDLAAIAARVAAGRLRGAGKIGEAIGRVIAKRKVGKHFRREITDTTFTYHRDQAGIDAEAALDGIYVLRTSVPATALDPAAVVDSYKNLAHVERDFRSIKTDDLDLRPIHHRLDERVRAHVLICLLACYLVWHLRKAWAPLTFTDEHPPTRDNPVAPAHRSPQAQTKASTQHDADGNPLRSFRGLLDHLATLTRNDIHYHGTNATVPTLAEPTPDQRRAFDLIGTPIPLTTA